MIRNRVVVIKLHIDFISFVAPPPIEIDYHICLYCALFSANEAEVAGCITEFFAMKS